MDFRGKPHNSRSNEIKQPKIQTNLVHFSQFTTLCSFNTSGNPEDSFEKRIPAAY